MHESVRDMINDPTAPCAPLYEFVHDFDEDNNIWWGIGLHHRLTLFKEALDEIEELVTK